MDFEIYNFKIEAWALTWVLEFCYEIQTFNIANIVIGMQWNWIPTRRI